MSVFNFVMFRPAMVLVIFAILFQLCCYSEGYYFKSHHANRANGHIQTPHHQRHHSQSQRFPHLERLLSRLENVESSTTTTTTTTPAPPPPPIVHWKPQDSYEIDDGDIDDDDDDDDFDNDDDDEFDDEDDDEDEDDDILQHQPQADEHTSIWDIPQNEAHYPPMSAVSRAKWNTMGTLSNVHELRRQKMGLTAGHKLPQNNPENQQALAHMVRMSVEGECKYPKPKLVQVKNLYPHPSKIYLPRCTILHQCSEDTGCCKTETSTCVARYTKRVDLYFYTSTVGSNAPQRVEKLTFYNHTECMCENRNAAMMHRDVESGHYFRRSAHYGPSNLFRKQDPEWSETKSCRCPSKYSVRYTRDGICSCECFDKQRDCLRLKKGKDYFSIQDRQCIQNDDCRLPSCEFGSYLRLSGRCPKKRERHESWNL